MEKNDLLWNMLKENCEHARHHETQRTLMTNIILLVTAAIAGLTTFDGDLSILDLPLTVFLIFLGLFGAIFSQKYYQKFKVHMKRADHYQLQLQAQFNDINLTNPDPHNDSDRRDVEWVRLKEFWIGLHLLIVLLGFVLTLLCLFHTKKKVDFPTCVAAKQSRQPTDIR